MAGQARLHLNRPI